MYKEILHKFSNEILNIYIFDKCGKRINKIDEPTVLYISSANIKNFQIHKQLFNKKVLYIIYLKSSKDGKKHILNIGDKYKLYIDIKVNVSIRRKEYILLYIAILLCDFVVINKIKSIDESIYELDIALDLGKDIYAIPGNIFEYESYLANYSIKQGAIPICSKYDAEYILKENKFNVL